MLKVQISPGELIDKITILEIKAENILVESKQMNIRNELKILTHCKESNVIETPELEKLSIKLKAINKILWDIEDDIRVCEGKKDFGKKFVKLARGVYKNNDVRANLKREINQLLQSVLVEEKSYTEY